MTELVAGLAFGALGSGHCALMCGPLVMLSRPRGSALGYHSGRLATYLALGLVAGSIGASASSAGAGRALAVFAGLCLILLATGRLTAGQHLGVVTRATTAVLAYLNRTIRERRGSSFMFGVLNGLLPCGLVYAAVIGAAGFGSLGAGLLFLAGFGAGTIPALTLADVAGRTLTRLPFNARKSASLALAVVGVLLVIRGAIPGHQHAVDPAPTMGNAHAAPPAHEHVQ